MGRIVVITYALIICIIICLSWAVNHYRGNAITYREQYDKRVSKLEQLTATIADIQQRQCDIATLDAGYSGELASTKTKNETLRVDVAADRKRLRVNVSCSTAVREATGLVSVDNATSPRLANTVERGYFTLRERLMTMQKQLEGAQLYIREQCPR